MKILAIGAHADDIEIAAGGMLSKAAADGHDVFMCITTVSGYSDLQGNPGRQNEVATQEAEQAASILGAKELITLDFETLQMPYDGASVSAIELQINKLQPDVILSHWPHDINQDHRATAMATLTAARRHNKILMYEPFTPSGRSYEGFRSQAYYKFDQQAQTNKSAALNSHESEREKFGGDKWIKAIESRAVVRGYEVGADFAECFEVLRWDMTF